MSPKITDPALQVFAPSLKGHNGPPTHFEGQWLKILASGTPIGTLWIHHSA